MRKIMCFLFLVFGFLAGGVISAQETPAKKTSRRVGVGIVCLTHAFELDIHEGKPIHLGNKKYEKGIYAHAPSEMHIHLPKPGAKFTATVGPDVAASTGNTSVQFFVFLRGKCVFQSEVLGNQGPGVPVQVELENATEFILSASEAGGYWDDHSVWADAKVEYADGTTGFLSDLPYFKQRNDENIQTPGELPPAVIAATSHDGTVKIWDFADGRLLRTISKEGRGLSRIRFSPDGKYLAVIFQDCRDVVIVEAETAEIVKKLAGHTSGVLCVDWTPDGKTLVTTSDGIIRVWDVEKGVERTVLTEYPASPWGLACSPDGKTIAVGGQDKTIRLWDIQEGKSLHMLTNRRDMGDIPAVKFSPDGRFLASGGADKIVSIWDVKTGMPVKELGGATEKIECVAFSPDGKLVAAGSWDDHIYLWDLKTGVSRGTLRGHTGDVYGVQFTRDGKRLVSCGCMDDSIRVWNVETKKCERILMGHTSHVSDVVVRE